MNLPRLTFFAALAFVFVSVSFAANIVTFGAKGDGQTDCSEAIQRAVNAGGGIQFPSGIYRLTRPSALPAD